MRHSNPIGRGGRSSRVVAGFGALAVALIVAACGSTAAVPPASVAPTPTPTPDPHLQEPVTADQIFTVFASAKLSMNCPNANLGNGNRNVVKQINCVVGGWPLRITQYRSASALRDTHPWKAGEAPGSDEAPFSWAGLNVLVEFGPISARAPSKPAAARQDAATQLFGILDPLLWPIDQHSVVDLPGRVPDPTPAPSASPKPSKAPAKSPRPSASKKP